MGRTLKFYRKLCSKFLILILHLMLFFLTFHSPLACYNVCRFAASSQCCDLCHFKSPSLQKFTSPSSPHGTSASPSSLPYTGGHDTISINS